MPNDGGHELGHGINYRVAHARIPTWLHEIDVTRSTPGLIISPGIRANLGEREVDVSRLFDKFAGISAILAAGVSVLYGVFFALALRGSETTATPSAVLLMVSGLLGTVVVCALYQCFRNLDAGFALLALVLGVIGAAGAIIHGAYDLSTLVGPARVAGTGVNAVDPRGVLVFGISGLSILIFARLIVVGTRLPLKLGWVGYGLAGLLFLLYLGRLLILDPSQPILRMSAILSGFVLNPLWNLWIGVELFRGE